MNEFFLSFGRGEIRRRDNIQRTFKTVRQIESKLYTLPMKNNFKNCNHSVYFIQQSFLCNHKFMRYTC